MKDRIKFGKNIGKKVLVLLATILILIQFIPVQKTNPPLLREPNWDSQKTRNYAVRVCFDCHSNQTVWPFYSKVAPISWFVAGHVNEGRENLNFSEWKAKFGKDIIEELEEKEMPLKSYLLLHPSAKLNDTELTEFIEGLKKTIAYSQNDF
jgi:hypothetical protein